jgi:hypothetical protein
MPSNQYGTSGKINIEGRIVAPKAVMTKQQNFAARSYFFHAESLGVRQNLWMVHTIKADQTTGMASWGNVKSTVPVDVQSLLE